MDENSKKLSKKPLEQIATWRILKKISQITRFLVYSTFGFFILLGVTYLILKSRPLPIPDNYAISQIYDAQNHYIGQTAVGQPHQPVKLSQLPKHFIQATLAAEDKSFYSHYGFSLKGIARATFTNIQAGGIVQGASTITQQLARNLYLSHDRTWTRKIKEALLTFQLEIHYSKDKILEMYVNNIYYGHGCIGIGRAANVYFHKKADQLTLAESAFLSGIPRGPQYYSPYFHKQRAMNRQQDILSLMEKNQAIPASFSKQKELQDITIQPLSQPKNVNHSYFRDYIIQTAVLKYGLDESLIRHGGLKIYTTLDQDAQKKAEDSVKQHLKNTTELQGALLAVDPTTGYIKAMVGGKDYKQSQYNRTLAKRQPGSTFKSFLYLRALEEGITPITKLVSKPTTFSYDGQKYAPHNFNQIYPNKPITLRQAIAQSDNIYAVTTQFHIGIDEVIKKAHQLGISSTLNATPSLALGSYPVSPFELTQAYATIASGGIKHPLIGIRKIVDPYGRTIVEDKPTPERIASPAHTFVLTQLLKSVFQSGGTAHRVKQIYSGPIAGKTGSTDWDSWISGYTPDLVTTVWVGYDLPKNLSHSESRYTQYIFGKFMRDVSKGEKQRDFAIPHNVKAVSIDIDTGYLATSNCPHQQKEFFVTGTEPKKTCPHHPETKKSLFSRLIQWFTRSKDAQK